MLHIMSNKGTMTPLTQSGPRFPISQIQLCGASYSSGKGAPCTCHIQKQLLEPAARCELQSPGMFIYRAPGKTSVLPGFSTGREFILGKPVLGVRSWFHGRPRAWPTLSFSLIFVPSPKHSATKRPRSIIRGGQLEVIK